MLRQPLSVEVKRKPLIWNPVVLDSIGRQLGERTHIDWVAWDCGPASSMLQQTEHRHLDAQFLVEE